MITLKHPHKQSSYKIDMAMKSSSLCEKKQDRFESEKLKEKLLKNSKESLLINTLLIWKFSPKACWKTSVGGRKMALENSPKNLT